MQMRVLLDLSGRDEFHNEAQQNDQNQDQQAEGTAEDQLETWR